MPVLSSAVSALSTFYQDSLDPFNADDVELSTIRLLAKLPTIAAYAYKKSIGQPFLYPDNSLGLVENFLRMTFGFPAEPYEVDPEIARALDILLILHADHEQNCSTSTVRMVGSSQRQPVRLDLRGHQRAVRAAARRGQPGRAGDAAEDPERGERRRRELRQAGQEQGGQGRAADGLRAPRLQELRPAREDRQAERRRDPQADRGQRPAAGHRQGARGEGAGRRLLHRAQALPERRLLHRRDLPRDGLPHPHVHRAVRARAAAGLDRALARDDQRPHHEDRAARASCTSARRSATTPPKPGAPGRGRPRSAPLRRLLVVDLQRRVRDADRRGAPARWRGGRRGSRRRAARARARTARARPR